MKRGGSLSGTVFAPDGHPVAGATVVVDQSSGSSSSDQDRRIRSVSLRPLSRSRVVVPPSLTVQATGLAAMVRKLLVTPTIPEQVIRLDRPRPLRGRVVDSQGKAVAGALVESTQGFENGKLDWQVETDAQGRFEWPEAPTSGEILLDASKPAFRRRAIARHFEADQREITITLHRPLHLHGTVTDAATRAAR